MDERVTRRRDTMDEFEVDYILTYLALGGKHFVCRYTLGRVGRWEISLDHSNEE